MRPDYNFIQRPPKFTIPGKLTIFATAEGIALEADIFVLRESVNAILYAVKSEKFSAETGIGIVFLRHLWWRGVVAYLVSMVYQSLLHKIGFQFHAFLFLCNAVGRNCCGIKNKLKI
ncbi:MAG: hypothetical protein J1E04_05470 [Alistipes sp.]|nr:hypothetical protein [Alistipes sp.]